MNILLTGASGQLGRALAPQLSLLGALRMPARGDFDLAQPATLAASLDAWQPALIVNAAAWTDVDAAEDDEAAATVVNADAVAVLAAWAAGHDALLLHFSTDHVFDGHRSEAYTESDEPAPVNAYGRSKRAGERALAASGAAYVCLRVGGLYGANARCFPGRLLARAQTPVTLEVVDDQIGTPTCCTQLAAAVVQLLQRALARRAAGTFRSALYHLAPAGRVSRFGFAECILASARARGWPLAATSLRPVLTRAAPGIAPRPACSVLASGRLRDDYGIALGDWRADWEAMMATAMPDDFLASRADAGK